MFGSIVDAVVDVVDSGWDLISGAGDAIGTGVEWLSGGIGPASDFHPGTGGSTSWWDDVWTGVGDAFGYVEDGFEWVGDFIQDNPWAADLYQMGGAALGYGQGGQRPAANIQWDGGGSYRGAQSASGGRGVAMARPYQMAPSQHPLAHWNQAIRSGGVAPVTPNLKG